jgi:polar amino acid transport system substrate-binding protein
MKNYVKLLGISLVTGLALAGCANPEDETTAEGGIAPEMAVTTETLEVDPEIAAMVPEEYVEKGTFTVAVSPDIPPVKYVDDTGKITGFAPEVLRSAGQLMGLEAQMEKGSFDSLVPGLESNRFDVIGSISDFEERRSEIDFIDYMYAGTAILTAADFDLDEGRPEELCGYGIAFITGTQQQGLVEAASKQCEANGDKPIVGSGYHDGNAAVLAVKTGQEDGAWIDAPVALYNVEQEPDVFKTVHLDKESMLYGMGVNSSNEQFRDALQAAMRKLDTSGTYDQLITGYGLSDLALPEMPLNQGGSVDG